MDFLKKVWEWLVKSSADPQRVSLTIKGVLNTLAGLLLFAGFKMTNLTPIVDDAGAFVIMVYTIAGAIVSVIGLVRKIVNTVKSLKRS